MQNKMIPIVFLAAIGCGPSGDYTHVPANERKTLEEFHLEGQQKSESVYAGLAGIADNFPDMMTLKPKACEMKPLRMSSLRLLKLKKIINREPTELENETHFLGFLKDSDRLGFLPTKGTIPKYKNDHYTDAISTYEASTHIAITAIQALKKPEYIDKKGFEPGFVKGWVVVFDIISQQPECHWPIDAKSGAKIEFKKSLGGGKRDKDDATKAMYKQLGSYLESSRSSALKKMIPE